MIKKVIFAAAVIIGLLAVLVMRNGYELRLVPNEPDLRPKAQRPSPQELTENFELAGGSERENRGFPQREILDLSSMFPDIFFREGSQKVRQVALTFDDGPDSQYTPQILDILKEQGIKATFFLIGNRAQLFPDVVKRMIEEGHVIGNHTLNHPNIIKLDNRAIRQEIIGGEEALAKLTGYRTALFRSPYGSLNPEKIKFIQSLNYNIIAWNVDSLDWKSLTAEQVKYNILENVRAGSIILQHSSGSKEENLSGSVEALREVIPTLKQEGYQFVTIPEMLKLKYKK